MELLKNLFAMLAKVYNYPGGLAHYRDRVMEGLTPTARNLLVFIIDAFITWIKEPDAAKQAEVEALIVGALRSSPELVKEIKVRGIYVLLQDLTPEELAHAEKYLKVEGLCSK